MKWEGEAPAEPQALCEARFGRSLTLPTIALRTTTPRDAL